MSTPVDTASQDNLQPVDTREAALAPMRAFIDDCSWAAHVQGWGAVLSNLLALHQQ